MSIKCMLNSDVSIMQYYIIFFSRVTELLYTFLAYRLTSSIYINKLEFDDNYEAVLCMTQFTLEAEGKSNNVF